MTRVFAFNIFFFLLPFVVYAAYLWATRGSFRNISQWQMRTVAWLALGGSLLLLGSLVYFTQFQLVGGDSSYRPARFIDGEIVPGELIPESEAASPESP